MNIVLTGGSGFIGLPFSKLALGEGHIVHNIDKETYCSNWDRTYTDIVDKEEFQNRYFYLRTDINDVEKIPPCDVLVHMAAESDVDDSIGSNDSFMRTNILGTRNLLEVVRKIPKHERPLFVFISTDEVVGDGEDWKKEDSILNPSSPYSSSKASGELLVKSWARTYGIDYLILRPANNYGLDQYPTKLIPKTVSRLRQNKTVIIHGTGAYKRCWVHTDDTSRAILHLINNGYRNETFNITTQYEMTNLEVVRKIYDAMGKKPEYNTRIEFVENRAGQDVRYYSSNEKLLATGFKFEKNFDEEIKKIVEEPEVNWGVSRRDSKW